MDVETIKRLRKNEVGERLDIKSTYEWVINEMPYKDFVALARLRCFDEEQQYLFSYSYQVSERHDTPKAREDFIKYLWYKVVQNFADPRVSFEC